VQGVTSSPGSSVEATVHGGGGVGFNADGFFGVYADGALGGARGGTQARVGGGIEYFEFGSWQLRGGPGGSFGAYQEPDLTWQIAGGVNRVVSRSITDKDLYVTAIAIDAILGYALADTGTHVEGDGAFVGLAVSVRYSHISWGR